MSSGYHREYCERYVLISTLFTNKTYQRVRMKLEGRTRSHLQTGQNSINKYGLSVGDTDLSFIIQLGALCEIPVYSACAHADNCNNNRTFLLCTFNQAFYTYIDQTQCQII